eukprot:TRINITY_DN535_c10_g1_i1.p1 TRINITY_DN535_c10_g1~~TRINITY_DN535_c10_g1_i1.p1  ORF type:complete len:755 (+),score=254.31 TRINITY_DN535_c10_g1_i1:156-2267(+)
MPIGTPSPMSARSRRSVRTGYTTEGGRAQTVTQSEAIVDAEAFGDKTIGTAAGFMLLVNNVTGPGLVTMCAVNTAAGYFTTSVFLFMCWAISSLSTTMMLEAIKRIPGNSRFDQRIEFTTLAKYYFQGNRRWLYVLTLLVFMLSFLTTLITSVIESAQTMDSALVEVFGKSCALQLYDSESADVGGKVGFTCVSSAGAGSDSPFGSAYVVSIGFIVVMMMSIPLGMWNLDDNVAVQNFAFVGLVFICLEWSIESAVVGLDFDKSDNIPPGQGKVPFYGSDQSSVFGSILFNYAFVTAVPSWCNERRPGVSINRSVWLSALLGTLMFFFVGLFGAAAWDFSTPAGKSSPPDLLAVLTGSDTTPHVSTLTRVLAYLFPIIALVTSIPIFSIIVRYNLMENDICGKFWATFWGAIFPWIAAVALYSGSALTDVCNWAGLLTIAPLNFMLPAYFYIKSTEDMEQGDAAADSEAASAAPTRSGHPTPVPPIIFDQGARVDAWFPGYQWSRGVVLQRNENGTYCVEWDEQDEKGVTTYTPEVPSKNLRICGATRKSEYLPNSAYKCPRTPRVDTSMSPEQKAAKQRVDDLQLELDRKEQEIEDIRASLHELIVEHPDAKEMRAEKDRHLALMFESQREAERIMDEMREARKAAIGKGGRWELLPEQRDELFTALPHRWSARTRIGVAWGLLSLCVVINIVALVYAFKGL